MCSIIDQRVVLLSIKHTTHPSTATPHHTPAAAILQLLLLFVLPLSLIFSSESSSAAPHGDGDYCAGAGQSQRMKLLE